MESNTVIKDPATSKEEVQLFSEAEDTVAKEVADLLNQGTTLMTTVIDVVQAKSAGVSCSPHAVSTPKSEQEVTGRLARAIKCMSRAEELLQKNAREGSEMFMSHCSSWISRIQYSHGLCYYSLGNIILEKGIQVEDCSAEFAYKKAIEHFEIAEDSRDLARDCYDLGCGLLKVLPDEAEKSLWRAVSICRNCDEEPTLLLQSFCKLVEILGRNPPWKKMKSMLTVFLDEAPKVNMNLLKVGVDEDFRKSLRTLLKTVSIFCNQGRKFSQNLKTVFEMSLKNEKMEMLEEMRFGWMTSPEINALLINDIKVGSIIEVDRAPYKVLEFHHVEGEGEVRTKLRNYVTGKTVDKRFDAGRMIDDISKKIKRYWDTDGDEYVFFDLITSEKVCLKHKDIRDKAKFLQEGMVCTWVSWEGKVFDFDLPITFERTVIAVDPSREGDIAQGGSKPATLDTGAIVNVPLFVDIGDVILVDTRTGQYTGPPA